MSFSKLSIKRNLRSLKASALAAIVLLGISSCGDDDPAVEPQVPATIGDIVINELLLSGNKGVELFNSGTRAFDVSDYWLCLGPGAYFRLGDLDISSGSTSLSPGAYLSVNMPGLPEASGGLGLYINNDDFTSSNNIISFVQYGAAGSAREAVAIAANVWTSGEYVPLPAIGTNSISYDGAGNGAADWIETEPTLGNANGMEVEPQGTVIFNEVQFGGSQYVELYNNGSVAVDISDYWLCLGPGRYSRVGTLNVATGQLNLQPGETVVVQYTDLTNADSGLGLYRNNSDFTSSANIADFIQYGASNTPRENVAVAAGIWTSGAFVPTVNNLRHSVARLDNTSGDAAADWSEAIPSFGQANTFERFRSIAINEVGLTSKYVEIRNNDTESVDLSDYWLCLGPGQYARIGALNVKAGDLNLGQNELLVVEYSDLPDANGSLGLYRNNSGFANSINIIDFVQFGAGGTTRESVAVEAGIWTANEFVANPLPGNTIEFDGDGNAVTDWRQAYPSFGAENRLQDLKGTIAITEVDYANLQQVEIRNNSGQTTDLSNYWLCLGPGEYRQISNLTVISGAVNLEPGAHLVVTFDLLGDTSEGLGLYSTNAFADPDAIVDFVQYGASGSARENVAVSAGIWTAGEFIDNSNLQNGNSLSYDGGGISQSDWVIASNPTLGEVNNN